MKAVIPAAGLGSRFLPATKAQPKEMLPLVDKPAIQYIVEEAIAAGADEVIIVNSHDKKSIEEQFTPNPALVEHLRNVGKDKYADAVEAAGNLPVSFVYQEEPLGLGHAVHMAAQKTGSDAFFVMLGDVLVPGNMLLQRMSEVSLAHGGASVIAVVPVSDDDVSRYGIIAGEDLGDGVWHVTEMIEKPALEEAPSNLGSFGRYLLSPTVMRLLEITEPGAGGEIQLTDALAALIDQEDMYAVVIDPADGYDTGTVPSWIAANVAQGMKDPETAAYLKQAVGELFA